MQQTWTLSGAYANWRLTVAIEPADPEVTTGVKEWPSERLAPVVGHFFEAVNYYEVARDVEELRGLS